MGLHGKPVIVLLLSGLTSIVSAQELVSVEQLERVATSVHGEHDAQAAQQLSQLQLKERLSGTRLTRILAALPGPEARRRMQLIADAAASLDLPASDIIAKAPPDRLAQIDQLNRARDYVVKTLTKLPNFFATRETSSFISRPANTRVNSINTIKFEPFDEVDNSSVTVLYRDGHEVIAKGKRFETSAREVKTIGEFGPILATVWNDASKGQMVWSHWESGETGELSIFHFSVPQQASHYSVNFPGLGQETQHLPAYHGEIALDPQDGSILRLTLVAELDPQDAMTSATLSVVYGLTEIGGAKYICPIKSIALAEVKGVIQGLNGQWIVTSKSLGDPRVYMNEVLFTQYHLFRAEARILTEEEAAAEQTLPPASPVPASNGEDAPGQTLDRQAFVPASGTHFNVADLERAMSMAKSDGISDDHVLELLANIQLTQRLTSERLARLLGTFQAPRVRDALIARADAATFLELPDSDLARKKAPEASDLASMRARAIDYVQTTVSKLPDFSTTRQTTFFEDSPANKKTPYQRVHRVGSVTAIISYKQGYPSAVSGKKTKEASNEVPGILDEFRGVLETVIGDLGNGDMEWDHWEQRKSGMQAVFSYSVSKSSSHLRRLLVGHEMNSTDQSGLPIDSAYHGEIAIDPSSGSILRVTVIAELQPENTVSIADFAFEYGPVEADGMRYLCPSRSIGIEVKTSSPGAEQPEIVSARKTYITDSAFTRVHVSPARRVP